MKLALTLLAAVMLFVVLLQRASKQEAAPLTKPATISPPPPKSPPPAPAQADQQQHLETERDAVMARNARAMTPELKNLMMDAQMQRRSPLYKKLFDSLQLDSTTQTHLLKAIREREEKLFDIHQKQRAEGMKGLKAFAQDFDTERLVTDKLFGLLVGDEKASKIIQLEAEMRGDSIKAANSLLE